MRNRFILTGAVLAAALGSPALAQSDCQTPGVVANVITPVEIPMQIALGLAVAPAALPETSAKVGREITCRRGDPVPINGARYRFTGENTDAFPRRVVGERAADPLYYVAPFENTLDVIAAELAGRPAPSASTAYVIVRLDEKGAAAIAALDGIPRDDQLRSIIANSPNFSPIVAVDRETGETQVFVNPNAAEVAEQDPVPGGQGRFLEADGVTFTEAPEGGARHAATGFVCPAAVLGRARRDLIVYDPRDGGRDVSCGYGTPGDASWYTLYFTHIPGVRSAEIFSMWERDARSSAPGQGRAPFRPVQGRPPLPQRASFWRDADGGVQGLWMTSIGAWHVKVRMSSQPQTIDPQANAIAEAIFKAVYEQVEASD